MDAYRNLGSVKSGKIDIVDNGESFEVVYSNECYVKSPFKCSVSFSKTFTMAEILRSNEVGSFLSRFGVFLPK
jgi:hypothetical protein